MRLVPFHSLPIWKDQGDISLHMFRHFGPGPSKPATILHYHKSWTGRSTQPKVNPSNESGWSYTKTAFKDSRTSSQSSLSSDEQVLVSR